ncbi:hypothetical protein [Francisella tularensis]|nr:hypothetical protein [Francisella tularensis]AJI44759.1 hypothetical protein AS84_1198 [Francisella tularensis subsp. novicida F6168]APC99625.1 hypothetical protein KX03_1357 [Francisella tularensis subsp. novicida]EDN36627.1 predicted protein [Francisella tularensis subsp. novicida GA99-3549]
MNNIDKNFETLVMNISLYYQQEYQFITSKLDNCLKITKKLINNGISKRTDVYNLTFLIQEIKYSTNYIFSDKTSYLSETILLILKHISNSDNYDEIKNHLKTLKILIEKYKLTLEQDFSEKIKDIRTKDVTNITVKLFNKLTEEDIVSIDKDELVQIYSKTINNPNEALINEYIVFFNRLKTFLKELYSIKNFIPIKENPILSLLKLAYLIKNGFYKKKRLCNSDILLLKAFFSSKQDIKKLDTVNIYLKKDNNVETLNKIQTTILSKDLGLIIDYIELQVFSISRFFYDFCISDIFFPSDNQQIDVTNSESLEQLICCFKKLPTILFDENMLYKKINTRDEPYRDIFTKNNYKESLQTIIENSPANLLTKIANKYFQMLLEVATIINIQLSKNDLELLLPFLDFERYFNEIAMEIAIKPGIDLQMLNKKISNIIKLSHSMIEAYNILKSREDDIINNGNFISLIDIDKLNFFINTKEFLTFKEIKIIKSFNNTDININKVLNKIDKNISNAKYQNASLNAKELTMQLLYKVYYSCPKLIGIHNLPPFSHNLYLMIKEIINSPALDNMKNKQESYWRI